MAVTCASCCAIVQYRPPKFVALISWGGSDRFGGQGYLPYGWDLVVVAVVGFAFYVWGVHSGWRTPAVEAAHGNVPTD